MAMTKDEAVDIAVAAADAAGYGKDSELQRFKGPYRVTRGWRYLTVKAKVVSRSSWIEVRIDRKTKRVIYVGPAPKRST